MSRPVFAKAVVGALLALATWGGTALADDDVSNVEWFGLLGAVVTGGLVYLVKNGPELDPTTSTPDVPDRGEAPVVLILAVVGVVLLVLLAIGVL